MLETISHTGSETIKRAPVFLRELRGWLLAAEHQAEQRDGDTSWFRETRAALSYAIELTEEARNHFIK